MDQTLKSPGQSALEDAFHRLFELSRSEAAPTLEQRLDRLARLRAVIADNEAGLEAAISADFGHRCQTETVLAETMFVLGEIKHAAKHLKKWMAPRRSATALQFMPARNRLIPQPLGVVGIIAPWNYPLQLTLAPAVGALAAGNRVMIKPSELTPRFAALLRELVSARFDAAEMIVTGIEDDQAHSSILDEERKLTLSSTPPATCRPPAIDPESRPYPPHGDSAPDRFACDAPTGRYRRHRGDSARLRL